jgi:hypothetical protein
MLGSLVPEKPKSRAGRASARTGTRRLLGLRTAIGAITGAVILLACLAPAGALALTPAPLPPTNVVATAGDGQAVVTWNASSPLSSAITGYSVTSTPGNKTCSTTGGRTGVTTCTVTGLTNGTAYTFTAKAYYTSGTGKFSLFFQSVAAPASNKVTPVGVPGAPQKIKVVVGNASAAISWQPPLSNGGSKIIGYEVVYMVLATPTTITCTTNGGLSCALVGLANGQKCQFAVRAENALGQGPVAVSGFVTPNAAAATASPTTTPAPTETPTATPTATPTPSLSASPSAAASTAAGAAGSSNSGGDNTPIFVAAIVVLLLVVIAMAVTMALRGRRRGTSVSA